MQKEIRKRFVSAEQTVVEEEETRRWRMKRKDGEESITVEKKRRGKQNIQKETWKVEKDTEGQVEEKQKGGGGNKKMEEEKTGAGGNNKKEETLWKDKKEGGDNKEFLAIYVINNLKSFKIIKFSSFSFPGGFNLHFLVYKLQ